MSRLITSDTYSSIARMFGRLKQIESWRGKIPTQEGFSKEDKEGLNLIVFALIKPLILTEDEDLSGIPAYVLSRLYKKAYTWDAKPKNINFFRSAVVGFDRLLDNYVMNVMEKDGVNSFAKAIRDKAETLSPKVLRAYKAARLLATLVEYEEMADRIRPDSAEETRQQVYSELRSFSDIPYFTDIVQGLGEYHKLKTLIRAISASRYTFRWQGYIGSVRCSILAHMLESAIIGYLMNLEVDRETDALQDFWVLLFHDLPEIWTDDIPSPVKDGVEIWDPTPELVERLGKSAFSLRGISEFQELDALEEHFYSKLPKIVEKFFRKGVMLEDVKDAEKKQFYKAADYFSADLEVWWNIKGGSREAEFYNILVRSSTGNRTHYQKEFLDGCIKQCQGIIFLN